MADLSYGYAENRLISEGVIIVLSLYLLNYIASLKGQREKIAARLRKDQTVQLHVHTMEAALDGMSHLMQQWDEEMIRQLVHTVKVISADHIKVYLYDGTEIDQKVSP